jgi:NAD(P)-dependent dehydrogenase (short-subunit alcohol dehydrogenase family)
MSSKQKVAIVTGASQGIGAALVKAFRERGYRVVATARSIEHATRGIRMNAVSPGIIKTPMHPAETHDFLAKLRPVGRMGEVRDIVGAVLFLDAAPFVTGEILHVDGGQSAGH